MVNIVITSASITMAATIQIDSGKIATTKKAGIVLAIVEQIVPILNL
jgi:hypothetical protein